MTGAALVWMGTHGRGVEDSELGADRVPRGGDDDAESGLSGLGAGNNIACIY